MEKFNLSQIIERKDFIWGLAEELLKENPSLNDLEEDFPNEVAKLNLKLESGLVSKREFSRNYIDLCLCGCLCSILLGMGNVPKPDKVKLKLFAKVLDQLPYYLGNTNLSAQDMILPFYKWFCYGRDLNHRKLGYRKSRLIPSQTCSKSCQTCKEYSDLGWQPLGVIAIPGFRCKHQEKCRCGIEYK